MTSPRSGALRFYTLLLVFAMPFMLLRLFWRGFGQRGYWQHIGERFGFFPPVAQTGAIWVHAVSVGETRAAEPLIRALKLQYPGHPILLTGMTPTGRATALSLFGQAVIITYLPYDVPFAMRRLQRHFRPRILLMMETELWPNLLAVCQQACIPTLLVNARLSVRSASGYARWQLGRALINPALQSLAHIGAQSEADAERLRHLGARAVTVTGNLKFDVVPNAVHVAQGAAWRQGVGNRPVLLIASSREGEESLLLDAYLRTFDAQQRREQLLIVVPRHPQRFDAVFTLVQQKGLSVVRRSLSGSPDRHCEVWLGDAMGEMAAYYACADVAIIGGSFLPLGGQNMIEACALGKPAIIGPSTFNFAEATRLARQAGALRCVANADEAMQQAQQLLQDPHQQQLMSQAAQTFADMHRGATANTMALIRPWVDSTAATIK